MKKEASMMMIKPITIVGLINDPKKRALTTKVNTKLSGKMADKTLASSYLNAEVTTQVPRRLVEAGLQKPQPVQAAWNGPVCAWWTNTCGCDKRKWLPHRC